MNKIKKLEGWRYTDDDRFKEMIVNKINELIDSQNVWIQTQEEELKIEYHKIHPVFDIVK